MSIPDEPWYAETLALAQRLHAGQVDKAGMPKAGHVERVARRLVEMFPDATKHQVQAALLHDVIEDCPDVTALELNTDHGISASVLLTVFDLTHDKATPYLDYIRKIAASRDMNAIRVKLADNADNSDPKRPDFPGRAALMHRKYIPARAILEAALPGG